MIRITHLNTHHLITTTNTKNGGAFTLDPDNSLGTPVASQFIEVVQGGFRSREDNNVSLPDIIRVVRIEKMDARILFQGIKISIIGEMTEHHHGHIHLTLSHLERFLRQCHRVLFLDMDISIIRYHTQYGYSTDFFQHLLPFIKESHISSELIDNDTLNKLSIFWIL